MNNCALVRCNGVALCSLKFSLGVRRVASLPASTVRVPPAILRRVVAAVGVLNARGHGGPRPFLAADLLREAIAEGVPVVLARHGLAADGGEYGDAARVVEIEPTAPREVPQVATTERKQADWPSRVKAAEIRAARAKARAEGVRLALDFARPLIEAGKHRAEVCAALNAAGLLNTTKGNTPREWRPDALDRALTRNGGRK